MIRTINEHYRTAKSLRQKAELAPKERRKLLLQLAKVNLMFAQAQLRDPSLRPKSRLSTDQYRAIAEVCLQKRRRPCVADGLPSWRKSPSVTIGRVRGRHLFSCSQKRN
jgi:hypothetical protein